MNDKNKNEGWKRMCFKGNKVWVAVKPNGKLNIENEKVLIKYNLKQDYEYQVIPENLQPVEMAVPSKAKKKSKSPSLKKSGLKKSASKESSTKKSNAKDSSFSPMSQANESDDIPENTIKIYTDGASSGNPGPAGIGVFLIFKDKNKEISKYIGHSTNNIAELTAIKVALEELKRCDLPVRIYSDSSYSIGLLTKNWKPKKNQELVSDIKLLMKKFSNLNFIKVKGHSGIYENEIADQLATSAIKKGRQ